MTEFFPLDVFSVIELLIIIFDTDITHSVLTTIKHKNDHSNVINW